MSKKFEKMLSPVGTAKYAYLNVPNDKFAPIFKTDLIVAADKCVEFCKALDEKAEEAYQEAIKANPAHRKAIAKYPPYSIEVDESGFETGNVVFKFKASTTVAKKDGTLTERKIRAFDSKAKPITMPAVYSGSTIRVEFAVVHYYNPSAKQSGISMRILSVQILSLVTFDTDGKSRGYAEEEEYGYVGEVPAAPGPIWSQSPEVHEQLAAGHSLHAEELRRFRDERAAGAPVQGDPKVEASVRDLLHETVTAISKEENQRFDDLLHQLTMDPNGFGGVATISEIPYHGRRLDGTWYSPLMATLDKAKKRLAASESSKIPFPEAETAAGVRA